MNSAMFDFLGPLASFVGALGGAGLAGYLSIRREDRKQSEINNRTRGKIFLQKKADSLIKLNTDLTDCENKIDQLKKKENGSELSEIIDVSETEAKESIRNLMEQSDKSNIFLSENQDEDLQRALQGIMYLLSEYSSLEFEEFKEKLDEEEARDRISKAKDMLKDELDGPTKFD